MEGEFQVFNDGQIYCGVTRQCIWINQKEKAGKAAVSAGLREGDIVVRVDGKRIPRGRGRFNEFVKLNYKVGDEVPFTVLRKGQERIVKLPLVE